MKKDIICVGLPTWEGDYMKTIVQIMSLLALDHNVLYVDYPFTWKDVAFGVLKKNNAPWRRILGKEPQLRRIDTAEGSAVHVLTLPATLPTNWISSADLYKKAMDWQSGKVAKAINKASQQLGMKSPIVINAFNPFFGLPLVGKLRESLLLYYCYDEIRAAEWCSKHGGLIEDEFMKAIDGVITTSESLFEEKRKKHAQAFLVKNGVNFTLFNKAFEEIPPQNNVPVVGYLGSVDDRLDVNLFIKLAKDLPHYKFEVLGRVVSNEAAQKLSRYSNIEILGARQPQELPKFVKKWNAGLIPFKRNEFTKNIYPLKINEYLAAGLPVIMTPFANLSEFETMVSIEGVANDFKTALVYEIEHDNAAKRQDRQQFARHNSWEYRVKQLSSIIDQLHQDKVSSAVLA